MSSPLGLVEGGIWAMTLGVLETRRMPPPGLLPEEREEGKDLGLRKGLVNGGEIGEIREGLPLEEGKNGMERGKRGGRRMLRCRFSGRSDLLEWLI